MFSALSNLDLPTLIKLPPMCMNAQHSHWIQPKFINMFYAHDCIIID